MDLCCVECGGYMEADVSGLSGTEFIHVKDDGDRDAERDADHKAEPDLFDHL